MDSGIIRHEKRKKRRRILRRVRAVMILIIIAITVYIFLTRLPLFSIKNFAVSGNKQIKDNDIVLSSSLLKGENIFRIDKNIAVRNIMREPYVESAEIDRLLPDTIGINIKEKNDIFMLKLNDKTVYIGKNSEVLSVVDEPKEKKVPMIEGLRITNPIPLKGLSYQNKNVNTDELKAFTIGASKPEIYKLINKVIIEGDGSLTIETVDGTKVLLGKLQNVEYKMKFLESILKDLKNKKIKFKTIDFTKSKRVVVEKMTYRDREKLKEENEKDIDEKEVDKENTEQEVEAENSDTEPQEVQNEEVIVEEEVIPDETLLQNAQTHAD